MPFYSGPRSHTIHLVDRHQIAGIYMHSYSFSIHVHVHFCSFYAMKDVMCLLTEWEGRKMCLI